VGESMACKNIIFLMTDQHRLDYTSFSGSNIIQTPNIDRIAQSVAFTCCQTVNPVCTPARTALLTGKYTHQIGTLAMSGDLSLQHPTFMQALQSAGYHTSGIGKFHFLQTWPWSQERGKGIDLVSLKDKIKEYGYDYIWEASGKQLAVKNYCDYCKYLDKKGLLEKYRDFVESCGENYSTPDGYPMEKDGNSWPFDEKDYVDVLTADKIIERIDKRPKDKPFYIFGSFCGPHKPFDPPQRYLDMFDYEENDNFIPGEKQISEENKKLLYKKRRAYKAMIKLIDDQVGRIFESLEAAGLLDETVIIFSSDHGEMLGDHFRVQKSVPWKHALTVPTAIRHPEYLSGQKKSFPIEITDITATILDIAGLSAQKALSKSFPAFHDSVPCRSLMPIIRKEEESIRDYSFSECDNAWQVIQTKDWKYIRYFDYKNPDEPNEAFYCLADDSHEIDNQINKPELQDTINWYRRRREFILDMTPAAQTTWAPLLG
jgi:arylsulfatase A-like enzyme